MCVLLGIYTFRLVILHVFFASGDVEKYMFNQREAKQVAWYTPPLSRMAPWTDHGRSENSYPGDPPRPRPTFLNPFYSRVKELHPPKI